MCDHKISEQVQRSHHGPLERDRDHTFACEAYETHATDLHRIVSRMVDCAECTEHLVAHTFLVLPAVRGVQPTLTQLTRTALVFACCALAGTARQEMQARIRTWYINSTADPGSPEYVPTPSWMAGAR